MAVTGRIPSLPTLPAVTLPALRRFAGPLAVLVLWQMLAVTVFAGRHTVPGPVAVLSRAVEDWSFVLPNLTRTLGEAAWGFLWGNLLAIALAAVFTVVRPVERILFRPVVAFYCLPLVAVAPALSAALDAGKPQIVMAAQAVFFTTLVPLLIGGRDADTGALEIVRAHGGSAVHQLLKVRLFYALPYLFTGLRMAAPAAVLGAVVAEYLGGDKGIGVAMVYSQQSLDVTRTWALALYTALLAGLVYALLSLIERWATPWAREAPSTTLPSAGQEGGPVRRALTGAGYAVLSVGLVLALWQTGIMASGLDPYFAKTPADVWSYLVTEAGAAANRSELLSAMGTTLEHTAVGLVIGIAAALLVAALVTVYAPAATLFMPVAVTLRTVPMVAMTPLIALVFGRGLLTVAVIAGLVTFFPVFVAVVDAMRGAPASACDVVAVYGAGPLAQFRRVRLPYALPAFLGATRVAAPTALLGALLAEWLATGDGIGTLMLRAGTVAAYDRLWASVALVTAVSFILYGIASLCESLSLRFLRGH